MENTTEKKSNELQEEQERCFVIMPISDQGDYPKGHFTKVYNQIFKPAIIAAGYEPFRVDEDKINNPIINKIFDAVQNCPMALCDLSNRNPNVLYELGLRQAYDKPVVLVQDEKTPRIFDVSGINTVQYSSERLFENVMEAREKITDALISTRDGKVNSIVKIVQAESASMKTVEVSQEDRMEVMLSGIMSEIKEIRNATDKNSYLKNYETTVYPEKLTFIGDTNNLKKLILDEDGVNKCKERFLVKLKESVTFKEINDALKKIASWGINVRHVQNGNELEIEVIDRYLNFNKMRILIILDELGEVKTL